MSAESSKRGARFIDIAVNLTDPVFTGLYHGKQKHPDDTQSMLDRASSAGVKSMIVIGGSLEESERAVQLAQQHGLYATVGCHPTRSTEFDKFKGGPDAYLSGLEALISKHRGGKGRVVAIGECGLDYDRTHFASPDVQKKYFRMQLSMAKKFQLPLYLHSRAAHADFVSILREEGFGSVGTGHPSGVVHSFTGTQEELKELISMGFYVGVNGCSLKTAENLSTTKMIPLDRILVETDAPWCSMTSTHASKAHTDTLPSELRELYLPAATKPEKFVMGKPVKSRNEPASVGAVAWVVHELLEGEPASFEEFSEQVYKNCIELFKLDE